MSNANSTRGDDAEAMRQSFEAFMLSGKQQQSDETEKIDDGSSLATTQSNKSKKKKKKKKKSITATPTKQPSTPSIINSGSSIGTPTSSSATKQKSKEKKRYYQLIHSFNGKVTHTWIHIDDQILAVLQNIVSIRSRLPLEWKVLHSPHLKDDNVNPQDNDGRVEHEDEWKQHGLQGKLKETPYSFHLHTSDVQLALSHDMTQHEKMLAAIRTFMTNLSECHEALGRVVDTLWKFHLDCTKDRIEEEDDEDEDGEMQNMVDNVTELYRMLSSELFRKQILIPLILESTQDEILGIEKGKITEGSRKGLQRARNCCKSWNRSSEESCIDESKLSYVLKLGKLESKVQ